MEKLLYRYKDNKLKLQEMKESILQGTSSGDMGMPRGTDISSVTENKALRLVDNKDIVKLEKDIEVVESYLKTVDDKTFLIIELKYFRNDLNNIEIYEMIEMNRTEFYTRLKEIREIKL